ncbi:MAG: ATP-binding protein [Lachnospirales bacterium]
MENKKHSEIERSIIKKYRKTIWRGFIKGVQKYDLIKENDKIAVCISGGKDSMLLAKLMQELQKHGKFHFDLKFIVMNPGYSEENLKQILNNAKTLNIPINVFDTDIFDIVIDIEENPCYLCARMRRGHLYSRAKELGCNKIALGHHFDDVIETILMGMIYGGQIQTMMPKLHSLNFEGMELIRPMYMVREEDIIAWAKYHNLNFLRCGCRFTEKIDYTNKEESGSTRQNIKNLIRKLREDNPNIEKNIFNSVENVNLSTIIGYHKDDTSYNFLDDYDERTKNKSL